MGGAGGEGGLLLEFICQVLPVGKASLTASLYLVAVVGSMQSLMTAPVTTGSPGYCLQLAG